MKITIEFDEKKAKCLMKLTGLKSYQAVINFALDEFIKLKEQERLFSKKLKK